MIFENLSFMTLLYIAVVYFLGGFTQGVLGVGLITVVIALLSFVLDVKLTIALVLVPTLVTGFFQMINGGNLKKIISDVKVFDNYENENLRAIALEVIIQSDSKTLSENEINELSTKIISQAKTQFNAKLR